MATTDLRHAGITGAGLATDATAALSGPAGNTGRRYTALPLRDGWVALAVYSTDGRYLPTATGQLATSDAVTLGVALVQAGALAGSTPDKVDVMDGTVPAVGGRRYRARLGAAETGRTRRVLLRVGRESGVPLPSAGDAFSTGDAVALGTALIAAAGHAARTTEEDV